MNRGGNALAVLRSALLCRLLRTTGRVLVPIHISMCVKLLPDAVAIGLTVFHDSTISLNFSIKCTLIRDCQSMRESTLPVVVFTH